MTKTFIDKEGDLSRQITEGYRKAIDQSKTIGYQSVLRNPSFRTTFRGSTAGKMRAGSVGYESPGKVYQFNASR